MSQMPKVNFFDSSFHLFFFKGQPGKDGTPGPQGTKGGAGPVGLPGAAGPRGDAGPEVRHVSVKNTQSR